MDELKINKATVISCFNNASEETKDALKHLFGEKILSLITQALKHLRMRVTG